MIYKTKAEGILLYTLERTDSMYTFSSGFYCLKNDIFLTKSLTEAETLSIKFHSNYTFACLCIRRTLLIKIL